MQLIILAAGRGVRLGQEAGDRPKSLVSVGQDEPYLGLQRREFARFSFRKKILVGGFAYEALQAYLEKTNGSDYQLLFNEQYLKGNLYSLLTAWPEIDPESGFFIFNADHFYSRQTYRKIFQNQGPAITIFCDHDRLLGADDMKVQSTQGRLLRMAKGLLAFDCGYVGVTYVPPQRFQDYYQACTDAIKKWGESVNVEAVLNLLVERGEIIKIGDISGSWWTEIDTPEDLKKARDVLHHHYTDSH
jgi:CDP-L-myo-inositol myo-inositolphosphotransferase